MDLRDHALQELLVLFGFTATLVHSGQDEVDLQLVKIFLSKQYDSQLR